MQKFVSSPFSVPERAFEAGGERAVIEIDGIDQAGPSFEGRVFLNNPGAGPDTPTTPDAGYAGSFHVYGYGLAAAQDAASAGQPPSAAMRRTVDATEAIRRAAQEGREVTVTIVPVPPGNPDAAAAIAPDLPPARSVSLRVDSHAPRSGDED